MGDKDDRDAKDVMQRVDVMGDYWAGLVRDAQSGRKHAAKMILRDFVATVKYRNERTWDGPIPWPFAQYLAGCFMHILCRVPADKALGLAGDKGRNAHDPKLTRLRNYRICLAVFRLKATGRYATLGEARRALARKSGKGLRTIEQAWKSSQRIVAEIEFRRKRGKKRR